MGVSGYPTIRMYPRGSKGGDDILIKPNKSLINLQSKPPILIPYAGWIAGSNRYQPYHGNRRDVTSLHNRLQVKKSFTLSLTWESLIADKHTANNHCIAGTNSFSSREHHPIHIQAQVLSFFHLFAWSLSTVYLLQNLSGWLNFTLHGVDIAHILLHIMNRWQKLHYKRDSWSL